MKIAVPFENGNVFQHFGKTKTFKIYEVENGHIQSAKNFSAGETGHEALAELLKKQGVSVVLCGGLGDGAKDALDQAGLSVCSGVKGNTDEAVEMYLAGELKSAGANCDHHHHHHEEPARELSHEEEEGACTHDCSCCGGGCHVPPMEGPNVGKTCKVHYTGTLNDGTKFDSSYDRNEPLEFVCGVGMMIRGFDEAVAKMAVGEKTSINLLPEQAYGPVNPQMIFTVPVSQLRGAEELPVGAMVVLTNDHGQQFPVKVVAKEEGNITFDANHELAGKELNFDIELVEVQ